MADAALGLAASIITIVTVAKACMDAYDIVSDAKHASEDLNQLVSSLHIERVKFLLWCQYVGLVEVMQLEPRAQPAKDRNLEEVKRLTPRIQKVYVLKSIYSTLYSISRVFKDSHDLLTAYTTRRQTSSLTKLVSMSPTTTGPMMIVGDVLWSDETERINNSRDGRTSMSAWNTTKWTFKDKKKFKDLVEKLRQHNEGLKDVLELVEKNQLDRQEQLLATTTPLRNAISKSKKAVNRLKSGISSVDSQCPSADPNSSEATSNSDGNERLRQLVALQQLSISLDSNEKNHQANPKVETPPVQQASPGLDVEDGLRLLPSDIPIPLGESLSQQKRLHTYCKEWPVIVEWKHYSQKVTPALLTQLKRRVSLLALQLRQSSRTPDFSILDCRGYFENSDRRRIGIIFEYPSKNVTPISLLDRLVQDRSERKPRGLGPRFTAAKTLTMSFYRLHSVGWLHKSFCSDNVLLFEAPDQAATGLPNPYICGFDFSRPDSPSELTENVPTVLLNQAAEREHRLYKHPDLDFRLPPEPDKVGNLDPGEWKPLQPKDPSQRFRFRKAYDIYSLGIVLLEIGLWTPVRELCHRNESIEDFRQRLHYKIVPELIYRMGDKYFSIVNKCLKGDFGANALNTETQDMSTDPTTAEMKASRKWLEAFLNDVVNELERCLV